MQNSIIKYGLVMMCIIFLVIGCTQQYPEAPIEHKELLFDFSFRERYEEPGVQSIIEQGEDFTLSVHYPLTEMPMIDEHIKQFIDQRMVVFKSAKSSDQTLDLEENLYELHLSYEIVHHSDRHFSIAFTERTLTSQVASPSSVFAFTYNIQNEKRLQLRDLFSSSNVIDILFELALDELYEEQEEWDEEVFEPIEKTFSHFALTDDSIFFWFNAYEVSIDQNYPLKIEISYDSLSQHLTLIEEVLPSKALSVFPEWKESEDEEVRPVHTLSQSSGRKPKQIAITFESGPHPLYTPIILDTLMTRETKATFFFLGNRSADYSDVVIKTYEEGHLIGNHTMTHPQMTRLTPSQMSEQIRTTQNIIYAHTGFKPYMLRPPYGLFDASLIQTANMPLILWSIDPRDDIYQDPQYIISHVLANIHDGAIIRLRDNNSGSTQALGRLIDALLDDGYEFVTLSELLNITPDNAPKLLRTFSQK